MTNDHGPHVGEGRGDVSRPLSVADIPSAYAERIMGDAAQLGEERGERPEGVACVLRISELQGISSQVRQEVAVVVTGLEEALFETDGTDPENLETHVFGALGILKTNLARLKHLDAGLAEYPAGQDAEGVA